jgi:CRP-like cAMP-binding protein
MRPTTPTNLYAGLSDDGRERLRSLARTVFFPAGTRIFEDGERADRFWVVRTGSVLLDVPVDEGRSAPLEVVGPGDLLGCSWLFPPYTWHLGAEAQSDVRAEEFDATAVRALSDEDPRFGEALARRVAQIIAHRMQNARGRLVGRAPAGGGPVL